MFIIFIPRWKYSHRGRNWKLNYVICGTPYKTVGNDILKYIILADKTFSEYVLGNITWKLHTRHIPVFCICVKNMPNVEDFRLPTITDAFEYVAMPRDPYRYMALVPWRKYKEVVSLRWYVITLVSNRIIVSFLVDHHFYKAYKHGIICVHIFASSQQWGEFSIYTCT